MSIKKMVTVLIFLSYGHYGQAAAKHSCINIKSPSLNSTLQIDYSRTQLGENVTQLQIHGTIQGDALVENINSKNSLEGQQIYSGRYFNYRFVSETKALEVLSKVGNKRVAEYYCP